VDTYTQRAISGSESSRVLALIAWTPGPASVNRVPRPSMRVTARPVTHVEMHAGGDYRASILCLHLAK
jgi:Family of unknown function (DUF5956)